jgi:hypothetical protein
MSQSYDTDGFEDLFYEADEGPARQSRRLGGADTWDEVDAWDEGDAWDEFDAGNDGMDAMEDAVAAALSADDADEFFRRALRGLRNVGRTVGRVARRVAPVIGQVARVVGPIASALPIPQAQLIGRVANVVGRLMADGADEADALDELYDFAEDEEDAVDLAAPVIAGLTIRTVMPGASRLPHAQRRQLVRSVTRSVQTLARRQGPAAVRAAPAVLRQARRVVARQGARPPVRALPAAVARTTAQVARNPRAVRALTRPAVAAQPSACPNCGRMARTRGGGARRLAMHAA